MEIRYCKKIELVQYNYLQFLFPYSNIEHILSQSDQYTVNK